VLAAKMSAPMSASGAPLAEKEADEE